MRDRGLRGRRRWRIRFRIFDIKKSKSREGIRNSLSTLLLLLPFGKKIRITALGGLRPRRGCCSHWLRLLLLPPPPDSSARFLRVFRPGNRFRIYLSHGACRAVENVALLGDEPIYVISDGNKSKIMGIDFWALQMAIRGNGSYRRG